LQPASVSLDHQAADVAKMRIYTLKTCQWEVGECIDDKTSEKWFCLREKFMTIFSTFLHNPTTDFSSASRQCRNTFCLQVHLGGLKILTLILYIWSRFWPAPHRRRNFRRDHEH
jgi:hypothetical protein